MRRMGLIVMLAMGLIVGCKHQTPEQKAQAKYAKQQATETKKMEKQAQADAKAAQQRANELAKEEKKASKEQAKADKKQQKPEAMQAVAREETNYYPDDRLKVIGYPDIKPENQPHWLDKHAEAMVAAGASAEAMLYESDFVGEELSVAGRSRLRLMMQDPPPTIYVAGAGPEAQTQARFAAVQKFWQDGSARPIAVKQGINEELSSPANAGLGALQRLDKEGADRPSGRSTGMGVTGQSRTAPAPSGP